MTILHRMHEATNQSHEDEVQFAMQAVDLFKQMDMRGDGCLSWEDFSSFVMQMDLTDAEDQHKLHLSQRYCSVMLVPTESVHPIRQVEFFTQPVGRIAVLHEDSEVVQIMVPPEFEGEPPRISGSLRHHTAYKPHRVLAAHHVEGQDTVVTSSTAGIAGPHYLTAWDLPTAAERADGGQHLPTIMFRITAEKCPAQSALHWSSKVELLFSASEQSGQLFAWSLESQARKFVVRLHECGVTGLLELTKLSGKTSFLVTGSKDGNMCVWDMGAFIEGRKTAEDSVRAHINAHEHGVHCIVYSEAQSLVFSAGVFKSKEKNTSDVLVWACDEAWSQVLRPHHAQRCLSGHAGQVKSLLVVAPARQLITADAAGTLRVWDLGSPAGDLPCRHVLRVSSALGALPTSPWCMSAIPGTDSRTHTETLSLIVGATQLEIFDYKAAQVREAVHHVGYNGYFNTFVTASAGRVCIWDGRTGRLKSHHTASRLCGRANAEITSCCVDDRGRKLVVGDDHGQVSVCNYLSGAPAKRLDPHPAQVTWLQYDGSLKCVTSGSLGGSIHVADEAPIDGFRAPDTLSGAPGRSVVLRDLAFGGEPGDGDDFVSRPDIIFGCCDPHLNLLACISQSGDQDQVLQLWDYEMFSFISVCRPPVGGPSDRGAATTCAFMTPCPALAGAAANRSVCIHLVPECEPVATLVAPQPKRAHVALPRSAAHISTICWALVGADLAVPGGAQPREAEDAAAAAAGAQGTAATTAATPPSCLFAADDEGWIVAWTFTAADLSDLGIAPVPPRRRPSYNPFRVVHSTADPSVYHPRDGTSGGAQPHSTKDRKGQSLSRMKSRVRGDAPPSSKVRPWPCAVQWEAHSHSPVTSLEWILASATLLSSAEDGLARLWQVSGAETPVCIGQLNVNEPNPGLGSWRFEAQASGQGHEAEGSDGQEAAKQALELAKAASSDGGAEGGVAGAGVGGGLVGGGGQGEGVAMSPGLLGAVRSEAAQANDNDWGRMMDHVEVFEHALRQCASRGGTGRASRAKTPSSGTRWKTREASSGLPWRTTGLLSAGAEGDRDGFGFGFGFGLSASASTRPQTSPMLQSLRTSSVRRRPASRALSPIRDAMSDAGSVQSLRRSSVSLASFAGSTASNDRFGNPRPRTVDPNKGRPQRPVNAHLNRLNRLRHAGL